jgi:hypothetical protein
MAIIYVAFPGRVREGTRMRWRIGNLKRPLLPLRRDPAPVRGASEPGIPVETRQADPGLSRPMGGNSVSGSGTGSDYEQEADPDDAGRKALRVSYALRCQLILELGVFLC